MKKEIIRVLLCLSLAVTFGCDLAVDPDPPVDNSVSFQVMGSFTGKAYNNINFIIRDGSTIFNPDTVSNMSNFSIQVNNVEEGASLDFCVFFDINRDNIYQSSRDTLIVLTNIIAVETNIDLGFFDISSNQHVSTGYLSGNSYSGWSIFLYYWDGEHIFLSPTMLEDGTNFVIDYSSIPVNTIIHSYIFQDVNNDKTFDLAGESYAYIEYFTNINTDFDMGEVNITFQDYTITVDDVNNSNSQMYLFGTINGTNGGVYNTDINGDVVQTGYAMFDDGSHGDSVAGDHIWTLPVNLLTGYYNYIFKFKTNSISGQFNGLTNMNTWENPGATALDYIMPPMYLSQDVTALFQVVTTNMQTAFSVMGIRGSISPLSWSTTTIYLNDSGTNGDISAGDDIWSGWITFTSNSISLVEYKYYIGTSPNNGWESGGNNSVVIDSGSATNILPVDIPDFF